MKKEGMKIYKVHITMHEGSYSYFRIYFDERRRKALSFVYLPWMRDRVRVNCLSVSLYEYTKKYTKISEKILTEHVPVHDGNLYLDLEVRVKDNTIEIIVTDIITEKSGRMKPQEFSYIDMELGDAEIVYIHKCDTVETLMRDKKAKEKEGVTC